MSYGKMASLSPDIRRGGRQQPAEMRKAGHRTTSVRCPALSTGNKQGEGKMPIAENQTPNGVTVQNSERVDSQNDNTHTLSRVQNEFMEIAEPDKRNISMGVISCGGAGRVDSMCVPHNSSSPTHDTKKFMELPETQSLGTTGTGKHVEGLATSQQGTHKSDSQNSRVHKMSIALDKVLPGTKLDQRNISPDVKSCRGTDGMGCLSISQKMCNVDETLRISQALMHIPLSEERFGEWLVEKKRRWNKERTRRRIKRRISTRSLEMPVNVSQNDTESKPFWCGVTVPQNVNIGDMIHVQWPNGETTGLKCPPGAECGSDILVVAPGSHASLEPGIVVGPSQSIISDGLEHDTINSVLRSFQSVLWPYLENIGWSKMISEQGTNEITYFLPAGIKIIMKGMKLGRDYFNRVCDILLYLLEKDKYSEIMKAFENDIERREEEKAKVLRPIAQAKTTLQSQKLRSVEPHHHDDNREAEVRVGHRYQVKDLPSPGSFSFSEQKGRRYVSCYSIKALFLLFSILLDTNVNALIR